jgi:hypothetical protein
LLIFAGLLILGFLALQPLSATLKERMEFLRDGILSRGEELIGRRIEYSSMGPSLFGGIDIRNLRVVGEGAPLISASRVHISWSLWGGIRGVALDQPQLHFVYDRDRDLLDLLSRLQTGEEFKIPGNLSFKIRNGSFVVEAGGEYSLSRISLDALLRDGRIDAQGAWNAEIDTGGALGLPDIALSTAALFRGSCADDFSEGNAFLSLPFITADRFRSSALGLNLELKDRVLKINNSSPEGVVETASFIIALDYGLDAGEIALLLRANQFVPADSFQLSGPWKEYNPFLAFRATGEASLARAADGTLSYSTDISGLIPPSLPLGRSSLKVKAAGDGEQIYIDSLELGITRGSGLPGGSLSFQGSLGFVPLSPNGLLGVRNLSLTGQGGITTALTITSRGDDINVFGETLEIGGAEFSALDLGLHRENGGLSFNASALRFYEGEGGMASIQADGSFDYAPQHLETRLTLDSFSAGDFVEVAGPLLGKFELPDRLPAALENFEEDLLQHTLVTTEIFATTDFEHLLYNAPRLVISYSGYRDVIALFSASGTDRRFTVDEGQILWEGGSARVMGQSDFSNPNNISFIFNTGYRDMNYYLEGALLDRRSLILQGSYGVSAYISSLGGGSYSGDVQGEGIPIPMGDQIARLGLSMTGRYASTRSWSLELDRLELADIPGSSPGDPYGLNSASLRLSGAADQDQVNLGEIFYEDTLGELRGSGSFSLHGNGEGLYRGSVYLSGEGNQESYAADLSFLPAAGATEVREMIRQQGRMHLRVSGAGMKLARFSSRMKNAQADGDLMLEWESLENFDARVNLYSLNAGKIGQEISAAGRASINSREFRLEDLRFTQGGMEARIPLIRANLDESRLEASGEIRGKTSEGEYGMEFTLGSGFAPIGSWLDYATSLSDFEGNIRVSNARLDDRRWEEPLDFVFSRQGEGIAFSGGPNDMIFLGIQPGGSFIAAFSAPFPVRGTFLGNLSPTTIDARGDEITVDLGTLWRFMSFRQDFSIAAGFAVGSLQIRGSLSDPEFYGSARGVDLHMQVPKFLTADIVPDGMILVFDGTEMYFDPVSAPCGKGIGLVSGRFWMEHWVPVSLTVDIKVPNDKPIPFGFDMNGVLARGTTSGHMVIDMTDLVFNISGDLTAQETEISLNAQEMTAAQQIDNWDAFVTPLVADISITAGRKVEFLWPTRDFPMIQAYANLGSRMHVSANSLDRHVSFSGDVDLRSGEIFYFERSFYIRSGVLALRENQGQFEPRITVRAETRDRSSTGPVTISLIVDNQPLETFTARFESSPALSQIEILSLLGQNIIGTTGEDGSQDNTLLVAGTDFLTQAYVVRRLERSVRNFLQLDMFSVRTQFLQNLVFSGIQDRRPVDRIGWVGNYFDNTSVFVGKYIGSDMFAQAMVSLRYDDRKQTFGGYTFEPDFGVELQSPLGNIRWNFAPLHPENWYINDTSITISWDFTF